MIYRPDIDGLRCLAVLPVILFHAGSTAFPGGFVGVDVFFVLSGYLITALILSDLRQGRFSLARFYERRARRILPALTLVVAVCLPFAWMLMTPAELRDFGRSVVAVGLFASNVLFWRDSGYFAAEADAEPLLHTWSLAVEEQFYLLFPLLLIALLHRGDRGRAISVLAILAGLSLMLCEWGWRRHPDATFYLAPTRAWELFVGALAAFATGGGPARQAGLPALGGLALILGAMLLYDAATPFPSLWALAPVGGTVLVLLCAGPGTLAARVLAWRPLVGVGLVSYSAYLWHQPLFAFARLQTRLPVTPELMLALAGLSLGLAALSWRFVEQPFRGARPLLQRRAALFAAAGGALALMLAVGLAGHLAQGFPGRLPAGYADRARLLAAAEAGRETGIRAGLCHFGQRARSGDVAVFLDRWDCRPGTEPRIAVFGDSHAADVAMALRLNGIAPLQLGGAGCPLLRTATEARYCPPLRARFEAELRPGDMVLLANHFGAAEIAPDYLARLVAYWAGRGLQVAILTPRPEYPGFVRAFLWRGPAGIAVLRPDAGAAQGFAAALGPLPGDLTVIDSGALFCPDGGCPPLAEGELLVTDGQHLTRAGARRFGAALAAELGAGGSGRRPLAASVGSGVPPPPPLAARMQ